MSFHTNLFRSCLIACCLFKQVSAQHRFVKTYGNGYPNFSNTFCLTSDKGFLLGIESSSPPIFNQIKLVLQKTDPNGDLQWQKVYVDSFSLVINSIIALHDGNFLVGATSLIQPPNISDAVIFKTDSLGQILWTYRFKSPYEDQMVNLLENKKGELIVCLLSDSIWGGYKSTTIIKLQSDGQLIWAKNFNSNYNLTPYSIALLEGGPIVVAASTNGYPPNTGSMENAVLFCISINGQLLWSKMLATTYDDILYDLKVDGDGNIVACGKSYIQTDWDVVFVKTQPDGTLLTAKFFDDGYHRDEIARSIIATNDGSYLLAGDIGTFDIRNLMAIKLFNSGNLNWGLEYGFNSFYTNYIFKAYETYDHGYAFAGDHGTFNDRQAILIKTTPDGRPGCILGQPFIREKSVAASYASINLTTKDFTVAPIPDTLFELTENIVTTKICENLAPLPDFDFIQVDSCDHYCFNFLNKTLNTPATFEWNFIGCTTPSSVQKNPDGICFYGPGSYEITLKATNSYGSTSYVKTLNIQNNCDNEEIIIPNVFTPDNNQKNDVFYIKGLPAQYHLVIYNRWGQKVYSQQNKQEFWDGNLANGSKAHSGIYYYLLTLNQNNKSKLIKGSVNLIRD
jgi:gliding motility-associated-like protein